MRIEIVGPPAAGKSTLAPRLAASLGAVLVDLGSRRTVSGDVLPTWRRRLVTVTGIARHPQLTVALLASGAGTTRALRGALGAARREQTIRRLTDRQLVVVDEGPLHAVLWTLMFSRTTPRMDRLALRLSHPTIVVRVSAPQKEVAARNEILADRLFTGYSQDRIASTIARYEYLCDELLTTCTAPVIEVNSHSKIDVPVLAKSIRESILT